MEQQQLGFRFADEEDLNDICHFLNETYEGESEFRVEQVKYTPEEIRHVKWYLSETKNDEMDLRAVCGFISHNKTATIHYLAVDPTYQRQGVGRGILHAVETLLKHQNVQEIQLTTNEFRPKVLAFLEAVKYHECGGGLWSDRSEFTKPTRYITYRKFLSSTRIDQMEKLLMQKTEEDVELESLVRLLAQQLRQEKK